MNTTGSIVSIHIAASGAATMQSAGEVRLLAGVGIEGDRYANKLGTYSNHPGSGRDITLIEIEALEALRRDYRIELAPGLARRNIVTHGVYLNHLVGKEFEIGNAVLRGERLCEPCAHLEKLTRQGVMRGLIHRGGLRADIVRGGVIHAGDPICVAG